MAVNEYQKDKINFSKWFINLAITCACAFMWLAWNKLESIETQVTTLVATQPFIMANIDDANKKIEVHILHNESNDNRQDGEIAELRRLVATMPNRVKLMKN